MTYIVNKIKEFFLLLVIPYAWKEKIPEKKKRVKVVEDNFGTMYYLGDLLDRLDDYFSYLKRFKSHDKDTYDLYSKVGGQVVNSSVWYEIGDLPPRWKNGYRPSFFLTHFAQDKDAAYDDGIVPKMMYFRKSEPLWYVEKPKPGWDLYVMNAFYSAPNDRKLSVVGQFFISLSPTGEIELLKQLTQKNYSIRSKNGRSGKPGGVFVRKQWENSPYLTDMKKEQQERGFPGKPVLETAQEHFRMMANLNDNANMGLQVRVKRGELAAIFCIDMLRTPYFFKDRDKMVTVNGKRKKIFHIVRGHKRILATGASQNVKTHFRGERRFRWNGYKVTISMPALHHADMHDLQAASIEPTTDKKVKGTIDMRQLGAALDEVLSA